MNYSLPQLLKALMDQGASDLHISPDSPPRLRVDGKPAVVADSDATLVAQP